MASTSCTPIAILDPRKETSTDAIRRTVNSHPLTVFVALTFALSWWSIPFADGGLLPHGPFLAAILVVALVQGRRGLREWFRTVTSWRCRWYWLLIGPGLVIAYLVLALGLSRLLGATVTNTAHLDSFGGTFLGLLLLGGVWEEPGWTGYALPLLQDRYASRPLGQLQASLHLGAIRAVWHLPLMVSGAIPWYDVVFFAIAFQFLISWLYNRTSGTVPVVMAFHLTSNVVGGAMLLPLFSGTDRTIFYVLFIATAWLLALLLNWPDKWSMGQQNPRAPDRVGAASA